MRLAPISTMQSISPTKIAKKKKNKEKAILVTSSVAVVGGTIALIKFRNPISTVKTVNSNTKKLLDLCRQALPENYNASLDNIKNKIFRIDLHSHSNHSDGWASVTNILNQAKVYADELFQKTGKKFTFALTDHDRVSGIREISQILEKNPEQYKNINFIPGVELSFSFNSNGAIKSGELLAYFIEPNSKSMNILVEELNKNRLQMIDDVLKKLGTGFCRSDLDNYFLNKDGETFAYNLHYRLRNYAQIKNRINNMAKIWKEDSNHLYKYFMDSYVFGKGRVPKPFVTPEGFDSYLRRTNVYTETKMLDENIEKICKEFFPKIIDGKIISNTENSFEKIIDTLKNEKDVVLGFAHPYFTAKEMVDFKKEFDTLLKYANGKIKLSENYHQSYHNNIPRQEIEKINEYLLNKKLIPMGGRDNHSCVFIG